MLKGMFMSFCSDSNVDFDSSVNEITSSPSSYPELIYSLYITVQHSTLPNTVLHLIVVFGSVMKLDSLYCYYL